MDRFLKFGVIIISLFFIFQAFFVENYLPSIIVASAFPLLFLVFLIKIDVFETESYKNITYVFLFGIVVSFFLCIPYILTREALFDNYNTNLLFVF